jgi:methionyl aminopeptidase
MSQRLAQSGLVKEPHEIDIMRQVCRLAAGTMQRVGKIIQHGLTTDDINAFVHEDTLRSGCFPELLGYRGFPKSACISVNDGVTNGIPGPRKLDVGDLVKVGFSHVFKGYHGATAATFFVGPPSEDAMRVTEVARRSLELGIAEVKAGGRIGDIGAAIQEFAEGQGCGVVRDFVGHGIGRNAHEEPKVSNVGVRGRGGRIRAGMTFCVQPLITLGTWEVKILDDEWTAVTADGSLCAEFKHTVLVTDTGAEVLTERTGPLANSEIFPNFWEPPGSHAALISWKQLAKLFREAPENATARIQLVRYLRQLPQADTELVADRIEPDQAVLAMLAAEVPTYVETAIARNPKLRQRLLTQLSDDAAPHIETAIARPELTAPAEVLERFRWDVFISHATVDGQAAEQAMELLQTMGYRVFLAKKHLNASLGTAGWSRGIDEALDGSVSVLLLVSNAALESRWVEHEWRTTHNDILSGGLGILLPICLSGPAPHELQQRPLRSLQCFDSRVDGITPDLIKQVAMRLDAHMSSLLDRLRDRNRRQK